MSELSDVEVFGSSPSREMSDEDVLGKPSPPISSDNTFAHGPLLPQPLVSDNAKPFVNSTTTGGIMKAFGYDFDKAFGAEQLGLSEEGTKWLSKIGIFAPEGQSKYQNPAQAFNEGILTNTAAFLDGIIRTASAAYRGLQGAGVEAGLPRDIVSIPDAFMGTPHPTGMFKQPTLGELLANLKEPKRIGPDSRPVLTGEEIHPTEIPSPNGIFGEQSFRPYASENPTFADLEGLATKSHWPYPLLYDDPVGALHEAKDLGVIGEDKPSLADMKDKPVAEAVDALRPKPEGAPEQSPSSDGGWRDRFEHFVGKLTQPEDVRQLIRDSADENNNFPEARAPAEPLSFNEAQNLADAAGMDIGEVDRAKLGREFNEAHVDRAMQVMIQATRNVRNAARDVVADASEENLIKFQEHLLRRDMSVEEIVGIRSTWGRIGNTLNKYVTEVKDGKALDSFIKETCPL